VRAGRLFREPPELPQGFIGSRPLALRASLRGGLRLLPNSSLGWLFVMAAELHLAEDALALHLLLKHLEGLSDTVVPDENLHAAFIFNRRG
jgi:hypothetical protein